MITDSLSSPYARVVERCECASTNRSGRSAGRSGIEQTARGSELLKVDPGPNYVLDSVIYALRNIGPDAREAIPKLEEISHRPWLTVPAQEAILKIEGKTIQTYHKVLPLTELTPND